MRYFICWIFPPLGLLSCGKVVQAALNLLLCCTIIGIPFAMLWSILVTKDFYADKRNQKLIRAVDRGNRRD